MARPPRYRVIFANFASGQLAASEPVPEADIADTLIAMIEDNRDVLQDGDNFRIEEITREPR